MTQPKCPCCGWRDHEHSYEHVFEKTILGRYVGRYERCGDCGSLFVVDPHWLDEAHALFERDVSDGGRFDRARVVARGLSGVTPAPAAGTRARWLDFGAGDGSLAQVLRDDPEFGAVDVVSYDPYVAQFSAMPDVGHYDMCLAIEVIESCVDAAGMFREIGNYSDTVVVSVELYAGQGPDWPYLACAWGQHVIFPTLEGLKAAAAAGGYELRRTIPHSMLTLYVFARESSPVRPRHVVLYNWFHAGDIVMSRTIIQEIVAANPDVSFSLECQEKNAYLWLDLGLPIRAPRPDRGAGIAINLHFGAFGDSLKDGLTHRNNVETYNRQAVHVGLRLLEHDSRQRYVALPPADIGAPRKPAVLVENGPVLSGQVVYDVDRILPKLADAFPGAVFYHSHPTRARRANLVDVSGWNLIELSALSEQCQALVCRLSAVMVASFTERNAGRQRIVFGQPLGCPIWDDIGVCYAQSFADLCEHLIDGGMGPARP